MARLSYPQKEAKLASSLNVGISCEEDLPMEHRIVGHRLYLNEKINMIQWQPRHFARMAKELGIYQPVVLEANPSLLARLAWWAIDEGVELYSPSVIVFTFEFISQIHVAAIRRVFSSTIISSYGTTETGFVMEECEKGLLHQNVDFCRIDFHPLKDRYGGPELGRMLVTTFQNPWNIILRFDVGDLIRLHKSGECACGRHEGLIAEAVEGRASNSTFTTEGGLVTTMALDKALAGVEGLRDYHMEQNGRGRYELLVMTRSASEPVVDACRHALEALYGRDGEFDVKVMQNILPGPAGKFRRSQANFDFDLRGLFV
jgi:phenylacetate-coenzyme A ligase PaaK-like adenylate-forming protein